MEISGLDYLAVFAVTTSIALGLTPIALRFALRRQLLDHPGEIKAQASPVPYLGGLAIVVSFALVVFVAASIRQPDGGYGELVTILGLGVVLALVGLLDDLRGLSPFLRLGIEIAAAVLVWRSQGAAVFDNEPLDLAVTVLWIVGVTNALNLLDNMDGLTAGVSAIAAFFVFVVAVDSGQFLVATLAIALAGCAVGFLRSNFHPARIYMGDAGALFLGFILAVLTLKIDLVRAPTINGLGVPILLLGVPLFDTTLVTVNRLLHRRSPLSGGRDHTSHRLVFVGIPVPAAVSLVYLGGASLGCLAVVLSRLDQTTAIVLLGWVVAVAAFFGVLLSLVPVYESSRRRRLVLREVMAHEVEPVTVDERDDPAGEPLDRAVGDG